MTLARHPQQEYICNEDDLGCLNDYFYAALDQNEPKTTLIRLWEQEFGVIRSRPHTSPQAPRPPCEECIYQAQAASAAKVAREQVLDALRKEISDRFHLKPRPYDPNDQEIPQIGIDELAEIFDAAEESLRSQQQEGGR
ncbi:MAG: hypothetical protein WC356_05615 [Candidatus Micrarchaeia archaeon]|jgi:hypothetical protein